MKFISHADFVTVLATLIYAIPAFQISCEIRLVLMTLTCDLILEKVSRSDIEALIKDRSR